MSDDILIVKMCDIRAAKMCTRGARTWFDKQGFDYSDFLKNGIDAAKFIATEDPMALQVVEVANGRRGR